MIAASTALVVALLAAARSVHGRGLLQFPNYLEHFENNSNSSNCSALDNKFRCNNGECIDAIDVCNGYYDCADKSDESFHCLRSRKCSSNQFQCGNHACIDIHLKCDGKWDCADGTDEDPKLCQSLKRTTTTPPTTTTTAKAAPAVCAVPAQPTNGEWRLAVGLAAGLLESRCDAPDDCRPPEDTSVDPGTLLIYACDEGYRLEGPPEVFCYSRGRWSRIPECKEVLCAPLSDVSREARCARNGDWASCETPARPGTRAFGIGCRSGYRSDASDFTRADRAECNATGLWQPRPIECTPDCGVLADSWQPLIFNGTAANVTELPWHASLYRMENDTIAFKCGATIIADNLVVTAAHCVYDVVLRKAQDPSLFYVATGNFYRDYDSPRHDPRLVKKSRVKSIHVHCQYLDLEGYYTNDVALVQLAEPFVLGATTMPACLDATRGGDRAVLEPGNYGKVAGFGGTAFGRSSDILQTLTVPYVTFGECLAAASEVQSRRLVTADKFCAGYRNGSTVCGGDSGGGLVFETDGKWYLRGIVSIGIGTRKDQLINNCDPNQYGAYTKVSEHFEWIRNVIIAVREGKEGVLDSVQNC